MGKHDARFKTIIKRFRPDFMELFYPTLAVEIDWTEQETLNVDTSRSFGSRAEPATNLADLAFKVRDRMTGQRLVIHIEPQEALNKAKEFPSRMFVYCSRLYEEYRHSVFPVVVFTSKRLVKPQPGTFEMKCFNGKRRVIQFKYEVIQLSRLSWKEYAAMPNPIAVAFAAKMIVAQGEEVALRFKCMETLSRLRISEEDKAEVAEFVEAYAQLNKAEQSEFDKLVGNTSEVKQMVTSWKREGIKEGLKQGIEQGEEREARRVALQLLAEILGALPTELSERIQSLPIKRARELAIVLLKLKSFDDLIYWLDNN